MILMSLFGMELYRLHSIQASLVSPTLHTEAEQEYRQLHFDCMTLEASLVSRVLYADTYTNS